MQKKFGEDNISPDDMVKMAGPLITATRDLNGGRARRGMVSGYKKFAREHLNKLLNNGALPSDPAALAASIAAAFAAAMPAASQRPPVPTAPNEPPEVSEDEDLAENSSDSEGENGGNEDDSQASE